MTHVTRPLSLLLLIMALLTMICYPSPVAAQSRTVQVAQISSPPAPTPPYAATPILISDDQVNAVSRNLYCPVCANTPLEVCPTDACSRWREQVRELLAQGESEDQVRQYFIAHFGMRTVGTPTDMTSVLLTTVLPFALLVIAALLIVRQLWRWYRRKPGSASDPVSDGATTTVDPAAVTDPYQARIEAELRDKGV